MVGQRQRLDRQPGACEHGEEPLAAGDAGARRPAAAVQAGQRLRGRRAAPLPPRRQFDHAGERALRHAAGPARARLRGVVEHQRALPAARCGIGSRNGPAGSSRPLPAPRSSNTITCASRASAMVLQPVVARPARRPRGALRSSARAASMRCAADHHRRARAQVDQQRLVAHLRRRCSPACTTRIARIARGRSRATRRRACSRAAAACATSAITVGVLPAPPATQVADHDHRHRRAVGSQQPRRVAARAAAPPAAPIEPRQRLQRTRQRVGLRPSPRCGQGTRASRRPRFSGRQRARRRAGTCAAKVRRPGRRGAPRRAR